MALSISFLVVGLKSEGGGEDEDCLSLLLKCTYVGNYDLPQVLLYLVLIIGYHWLPPLDITWVLHCGGILQQKDASILRLVL